MCTMHTQLDYSTTSNALDTKRDLSGTYMYVSKAPEIFVHSLQEALHFFESNLPVV